MTFTTWGQSALLSTTVSASPSPSTSAFGLASVGGLKVGHRLRITHSATDYESTISNIAGSVVTVSPALAITPSAGDVAACYATPATNSRLNGMAIWDALSLSDLKATDTTGMADGTRVLIKDSHLYRLSTGSSATADDYLVVAPTTGPGRWLLQIGAGLPLTVTTDTSMGNGASYIVGGSTRRTMTLPASPSVGPVNEVVAEGAGGFSVALNSGQTLRYQGTSYAYGYLLRNTDAYAAVRIRCTNTDQFTVIGHEGAITIGAAGAGYVGGGNTGSPVNTITKLTYSTESASTLAATLGNNRDFQGGSAGISATAKGYYVGQYNGVAAQTTIDDQNFSDDTSATLAAVLATARYAPSTATTGTLGLIIGGSNESGLTSMESLTLSNDTVGTIGTSLGVGKNRAASSQSATQAYLLGGDKSGESPSDDIQKVDLSSYANSIISNTLPAVVTLTCGVYSSTAAYVLGGYNAGYISAIRKMPFATETAATLSATLDTAKGHQAAVRNTVKGYSAGGQTGSRSNVFEDLGFANETSAAISATLATATELPQGVSALV